MYHKVSGNGEKDFLTVTTEQLSTQWKYLKSEGYTPILLSDLIRFVQQGTALPPRPILLTFDDGYKDNYEVMYPILQHLGMKANIFLVPSYLQQQRSDAGDTYLDLAEIKRMNPGLVEYGLHSFSHQSYKNLSPAEVSEDIRKTADWLRIAGNSISALRSFSLWGLSEKEFGEAQTLYGNFGEKWNGAGIQDREPIECNAIEKAFAGAKARYKR